LQYPDIICGNDGFDCVYINEFYWQCRNDIGGTSVQGECRNFLRIICSRCTCHSSIQGLAARCADACLAHWSAANLAT